MTTTKQTIAYATRLPTACSWVSRGMLLRMLRSMPVHALGLVSVLRHGDVNPGHQGRAWRELRAQGHRDGALYPSGFCISAVWRVGYIVRRLREFGSRVSKTRPQRFCATFSSCHESFATTFGRPIKPACTCPRMVPGLWRSRRGQGGLATIELWERHCETYLTCVGAWRPPPSRTASPNGWAEPKRNRAMTSKTCVTSRYFVHCPST
jgi:hypothetical protein